MKNKTCYMLFLTTALISCNTYSAVDLLNNQSTSGDLTFTTNIPEICGFKSGGQTTVTSNQIKFTDTTVEDAKKNLVLLPYTNKGSGTLKYKLNVTATTLKNQSDSSALALTKIKLYNKAGTEITQNVEQDTTNNGKIEFSTRVDASYSDIAAGDHTITAVATLTCS
ncbi:hypothetical protein L8R80_20690 [Vibrio splendidus]|uniref:hypothetical protein n=1 Tax=Vibrio splendidus TaxID=29497 RepID=UPI0011B24734|nr:hypothetical protein [Vibrio splendidus]MDH5912186.1 hypothetical protein [Vibrio splendidus]MDH5940808.1 hypothetical protein [Vibrio splendidus]MDH5985020.1 hypothetical protein [Vibrio splendidus]MDH5995647.1 hypothetical protein [Vibrio splendidus]MDH6005533.1 hypothetical protein [Vibrio splendidus]